MSNSASNSGIAVAAPRGGDHLHPEPPGMPPGPRYWSTTKFNSAETTDQQAGDAVFGYLFD